MPHTCVTCHLCLITSSTKVWWQFLNSHYTCVVLSEAQWTRVTSGSILERKSLEYVTDIYIDDFGSGSSWTKMLWDTSTSFTQITLNMDYSLNNFT